MDGAIIKLVELTALVATRATRSLCSATKLVSAGYSIEMRPTQSVLRRSGGGCILLQRCGKRDFLSIQVRKSCEINAITFSTMKREVQSLKSGLRALRTGHLSTSELRLPWTPEEKPRHESNGHAEYDNRCEICAKSSGVSRHPGRAYSESRLHVVKLTWSTYARECVNTLAASSISSAEAMFTWKISCRMSSSCT